MKHEIEILIKGDQGVGKTYIANLISRVLQESGIRVTGDEDDINTDGIRCCRVYEEIKITTNELEM